MRVILAQAGRFIAAGQSAGEWFTPWRFSALLGLLVAACFPEVVAGYGIFAYLDFGQFAYPVAFYHRECFWRGELPFWNPLSSCGVPFLAQWNTLTLYPLSLFYLLFPFPWSLGMFCLLHLFLAGMGMYFLAHRWTGNRLAGALAGAAFAFNGLTWYALMWPHLTAALAWMPWVVLTMERACRLGQRAVIMAALAGAMQMLSGGVEVLVLTWFLVGVWWLGQFFAKEVPRRKLAGRALGAGCLAVGLAAAQVLPFLDLLAHSQRSSSYGSSAMATMPLTGWVNYLVPIFRCSPNPQGLFVPPNHWTSSYYLGVGVGALAWLAVWRAGSRRNWLLAVLALFSLLTAMGNQALVYDWLTRLVPLLGFMRFPVKFVMLATFVIPLLAARGLAWLQALSVEGWRREWTKTKWLALGVTALMAALVWFAWRHPLVKGEGVATAENAFIRAIFFALVLGCIARLRRETELKPQRLFQTALIVLLWFDVRTHNANLSPTVPPAIFEPDAVRRFFNWDGQLRAGDSRLMESGALRATMLAVGFRSLEQDTSARRLSQFFDFNLLDHIPKFDGFYSLDLKEFADVSHQVYSRTNEAPGLMDFLGISYVTNPTNLACWVSRASFLPLVTAGQEPVFAERAESLEALLSQDFEPRRVVYLPWEARGKVRASQRANVKMVSSRFTARRLEIEAEADASALVVVAQTFYHPWHAYVDGRRTALWRANYAFQAVEVPSGKHQVILVYEDRAFFWGLVLSLLSAAACGGLWFWPRGCQPHDANSVSHMQHGIGIVPPSCDPGLRRTAFELPVGTLNSPGG